MTLYKVGSASVELPFDLPAQAGTMSPLQMARVSKPPRGLGTACEDTATAIDSAGAGLTLPPGVTADALRQAGHVAEEIDRHILQLEALLEQLKQGNLLLDHAAYDLLRKVNDSVKAQGKFNKNLLTAFGALASFMSRKPARPAAETPAVPQTQPA